MKNGVPAILNNFTSFRGAYNIVVAAVVSLRKSWPAPKKVIWPRAVVFIVASRNSHWLPIFRFFFFLLGARERRILISEHKVNKAHGDDDF